MNPQTWNRYTYVSNNPLRFIDPLGLWELDPRVERDKKGHIMHGDDDQIVPIGASALLSSKIVKDTTLKVYPGFPHGMCSTHKDVINADLLAFVKGEKAAAA